MDVKRWVAVCISCLLCLVGTALPAMADTSCEASADFGAVFVQSDIDNAVKALPPEALVGTRGVIVGNPLKTAMLDNLPVVAQQGTASDPGSPGTCEAQSFGYGLGSYTAARDPS